MHRMVLSVLTAALGARAAVIQGVVLEQASGRPLARAVVLLQPVPQAGAGVIRPLNTRAGRSGQFAFYPVQPGSYLLIAVKNGYFPAAYGQRLPIGRGTPLQVNPDSDIFTELRLHHKGAVTGRVLDENGVGTAGVSVLAYRARLPLHSAGAATSDDRGVYRIPGLDPGKYWVRTGAHTLDDGAGWLPTFGTQGRQVRDARVYQVIVNADATDADVSPEPGTLFNLSGLIQCDTLGPVTVTLSSETGRRSTRSACNLGYRFEGLAPGVYEVFARMQDGTSSGFTELFLERDSESGNVQLMQLPQVDFEVQRGSSVSATDRSVRLTGRRRELSETEPEREITKFQTTLDPGHWEFRAQPARGQYVESIGNLHAQPRRPWNAQPAADWFEVFIPPRYSSRIRIKVSDQAARIDGRVVTDGKPVPGAPVFLWPVADSARRSLSGSLQTLTNTDGRFGFENLPPSDYRILASFDVNEIDAELMDLSNALTVHSDAMRSTTIDLPVWTAP